MLITPQFLGDIPRFCMLEDLNKTITYKGSAVKLEQCWFGKGSDVKLEQGEFGKGSDLKLEQGKFGEGSDGRHEQRYFGRKSAVKVEH